MKKIICAIFLALLTLGIPFTVCKYSVSSAAQYSENSVCIANPFEPSKKNRRVFKVITLKGNDDKIMVATWTQESYTYAIDTDGISADIILDLIQQME